MSLSAFRGVMALHETGWKVGPAARQVLFSLAFHHNGETGRCFPSQATIAKEMGLTKRSVQRALEELEGAGLITVLPGKGGGYGERRSDAYRLLFYLPPDRSTGDNVSATDDSMSATGDTESPQQEYNRESNSKTRGRESSDEDSEEDAFEGVDVHLAVKLIWDAVGEMGKRRSSRPKVEKALRAALKRRPKGAVAEDHLKRILTGIRGYLASADARKENGAFEHGAHRTILDDVWESFEADAPAAAPAQTGGRDDEVGTTANPGPRLQRHWAQLYSQGMPWDPERGPTPGRAGCRIADEIQIEYGYVPFRADPPSDHEGGADEDAAAFD